MPKGSVGHVKKCVCPDCKRSDLFKINFNDRTKILTFGCSKCNAVIFRTDVKTGEWIYRMNNPSYRESQYHPDMTKEASEILKEFFLEIREKIYGSASLRDYEHLLWLAEDSARGRKSRKVTVKDARKAIDRWLEGNNKSTRALKSR